MEEQFSQLSKETFNAGKKIGKLDLLKELKRFLVETPKVTNQEIIDNFILPKLKDL